MERFGFVVGLVFLAMGVALMANAGIHHHYWGAVSFLVAGLAAGATCVHLGFFGLSGIEGFGFIPFIALVATITGFVDIAISNHATNREEAQAQMDFLERLIPLIVDSSEFNEKESELMSGAAQICNLQPIFDTQDLVMSVYKALHYGPVLTLIDGANSALSSDKQPMRCLDYYQELRKTQPHLFLGLERQYPWLRVGAQLTANLRMAKTDSL